MTIYIESECEVNFDFDYEKIAKDFAWFSALAASHRRRRLGGARLIAHDLKIGRAHV